MPRKTRKKIRRARKPRKTKKSRRTRKFVSKKVVEQVKVEPEPILVSMERKTRELDYVHVVTTEELPGYNIKEVKGLVWGTTVRSKFVGKDILALLRILVGGEIPEYVEMINEAKRYVIEKMVSNAKLLGANAVIETRINTTSQVVPGAVEICVYGTAVVVEPM